jgi:hypothetical protein
VFRFYCNIHPQTTQSQPVPNIYEVTQHKLHPSAVNVRKLKTKAATQADRTVTCQCTVYGMISTDEQMCTVRHKTSIPAAARSKAWVCGRSLAGIVGSNLAGGIERCVLSCLCLCVGLITRPEETYRMWCVRLWSLDNEKVLEQRRLLCHEKQGTYWCYSWCAATLAMGLWPQGQMHCVAELASSVTETVFRLVANSHCRRGVIKFINCQKQTSFR